MLPELLKVCKFSFPRILHFCGQRKNGDDRDHNESYPPKACMVNNKLRARVREAGLPHKGGTCAKVPP